MLLTSNSFLFLFLPFSLLINLFNVNKTLKTLFLGALSAYFYYIDNGELIIILLFLSALLKLQIDKNIFNIPIFIILLLTPLIIFKYSFVFFNFFNLSTPAYILQNFPIGLSFFTFQSIAYYFDKSRAEESESGFQIFTFLTFFPQLLAGPIVDISTFRNGIKTKVVSLKSMQQGLYRVSLGLIKKFLVADTLSQITSIYINSNYDFIFSYASSIILILSYTFQIYFDFSGYSDMAVGVSRIFGIKLPFNFNSPYKAVSIIDFWRRWHITLGRFFNDFLFLPFSLLLLRPLSKFGKLGLSLIPIFEIIPILFTFTLLGLWHGAAFTFIIFGFFHGTGLVICNLYSKTFNIKLPPIFSWFITFIFVVVGFVVFRSSNLTTLKNFILSFLNINQVFDGTLDINPYLYNFNDLILIFFSGMIIFLLPTTVQLVPRYIDLSFIAYRKNIFTNNFKWRPNFYWGFFTAIIFLASLFKLGSPQTFLYFQF